MSQLDMFNDAWGKPEFVSIELSPVDINKVLKEQYQCSPEFRMTKSQLWDMETKKALRPDLFIPSVIAENSARSWGNKTTEKAETFLRVSEQRLWLNPEQYGTVIENVHVDHSAMMVTFIGELQATSSDFEEYISNKEQPLFHVQHGVTGEEEQPLNTWKIIHQSLENEQALKARFERMNNAKALPEYVEIYIRDVLGIELKRRFS